MKHLKLFEYFKNRDDYRPKLIYSSFDIDDNLLFMNTKIYMEHNVDGEWITEPVDTEKFAQIRSDKSWRYKPGGESFVEFRDWGPKGDDTFLIDFKDAVQTKKFGPSWNNFIECLVNGNLFSIVTSRGHSPKNVRRAIYWLIYEYGLDNFMKFPIQNVDKSNSVEDQMLTNLLKFHQLFGSEPDQVIDQYIELCPIYTIQSPYFKKKFPGLNPEDAKKAALRDFNMVVKQYAKKLGVEAELGFSDDDPKFVKAAADEFTELGKDNTNIKYSVFDTGGDKKMKKYL